MLVRALRTAAQAHGGGRILSRRDTLSMFPSASLAGASRHTSQTTISCLVVHIETNYYSKVPGNARQVQFSALGFVPKAHLSPTAGFHAMAPTPSVQRIPVQVGASLEIDLSGTSADINVAMGDNLEEIELKPKWTEASERDPKWEMFDISSSNNKVSFQKRKSLTSSESLLSTLLALDAQIPSRWCSLVVRAGRSQVYIQNVREGTLRVTTTGGNVKLDVMKGGEAYINSGGGDVEASMLQAISSVQTAGGKLCIQKLQGTKILLDSGGGTVNLGSLYGDEVIVESKGGSVEAKHVQAQQMAFVSTDGGSVIISGLDGNASVVSKGGNVEIQLNEHAQEVTIDAANGCVTLSMSAKLTAELMYKGAQPPIQEEQILDPQTEHGLYQFIGPESASIMQGLNLGWRGSESSLPGGERATRLCKIVVSSAGQLHVKQRSWIESVFGGHTISTAVRDEKI